MAIKVTRLPNGIQVASDPMADLASVSVGVWVGVGARDEPAEINGVAHMLEHMAFKGTRRRNARQIAEEIESVGGHLNAYTSREMTAYYAKVLREDVPLAVDVLADILQDSTFEPEELARERSVILQEIGQAEDTPDDIVFDHYQAAAFPGQALGRPVLGTVETVSRMPRDAIMDYMRGRYAGERMVIAASGAVEHDRLVDLAAEAFARVPAKSANPREAGRYKGGHHVEERDLEQVHLVLGFPGVAVGDDAYYAQSVLATALGGGMSSRLFQEIREKRGLVYSIYAFASSYAETGTFGVYAGTGADEVRELVPAMCEEIAKAAESFDEVEIARARAQLRAGILMGLESTSARCESLGTNIALLGRPIPHEESLAKIAAVTPEESRELLRSMLAAPATVAALGPVDSLEAPAAIAARLKAA